MTPLNWKELRVIQPKQFMGDWDAKRDGMLESAFITFHDHDSLIDPSTSIILAGKGAGKTALVKRLVSQYRTAHITISADEIAFAQFFEHWHKLRQTQSANPGPLVAAWKTLLLSAAMIHVVRHQDVIRASGLPQEWVSSILAYLERIGVPKDSVVDARKLKEFIVKTLGPLLAHVTGGALVVDTDLALQIIPESGDNHVFQRAINSLLVILAKTETTLLLTIDEFDSLFEAQLQQISADETRRETLNEILVSLIAAVDALRQPPFTPRLRVKLMYPRDMFPPHFRDRVKAIQHSQYIHWTPDKLYEFCCKRIAYRFSSLSDFMPKSALDEQWRRLFPESVQNRGRTKQKHEDSFDYIARHTYYRPRDLQVQISSIMEACKTRTGGCLPEDGCFDSEIIRSGVSHGSRELAKVVVDEWKQQYPWLELVLSMFKGLGTVFEYNDQFVQMLSRSVKNISSYRDKDKQGKDIDRQFVLNALLSVGVFGLFEKGRELPDIEIEHLGKHNRRAEQTSYRSTFFFSEPFGQAPIANPGDLLCVHPVFHDRCSVEPSSEFIVGGPQRTR